MWGVVWTRKTQHALWWQMQICNGKMRTQVSAVSCQRSAWADFASTRTNSWAPASRGQQANEKSPDYQHKVPSWVWRKWEGTSQAIFGGHLHRQWTNQAPSRENPKQYSKLGIFTACQKLTNMNTLTAFNILPTMGGQLLKRWVKRWVKTQHDNCRVRWCWNHCLVSPGNRLTVVKIVEMSLLCSKSLPQLHLNDDERYITAY